MSGLDMIEDTFPHGTVEGHKLGCKGGACPGKDDGGDSCAQAHIRYQGDYAYRKAVDAGLTPPPPIRDRPRGSKLKAATSALIIEPTITVADSIAPPPRVEEPARPAPAPAPEVKVDKRKNRSTHPLVATYTYGCKTHEACPSFKEGGKSCLMVAREYWHARDERKRQREGLPPRVRRENTNAVDRLRSVAIDVGAQEITVTELLHGGAVVTIRVPSQEVAR